MGPQGDIGWELHILSDSGIFVWRVWEGQKISQIQEETAF